MPVYLEMLVYNDPGSFQWAPADLYLLAHEKELLGIVNVKGISR